MTDLIGNRAIEDAAIAYVIKHEAAQGREAVDTRGKGAPADVESGERIVEVKAAGGTARGQDLLLETPQVAEAECNPNFWVYLVDNVGQGDPALFRLRLFGGEQPARLIANKRPQSYFTIPLPVAEYDVAPLGSLDGQ